MCPSVFLLLAFFVFWRYILPFLVVIFKYTVLKTMKSKRSLLKNAGEWVVVTGATDGIGKAFAEALAKDSFNVMLISRNLEKLNNVAEHIKSTYSVATRIVVADFTKDDIYSRIETEIALLPSIACLVNNVGISYDYFSDYADSEFINYDFICRIINCNTLSVSAMTRMVLPKMLKQSNKGAAIINMGSGSSLIPCPYLSLYGATKSMVDVFTKNLSIELGGKITFQCFHPFFVHTAMTKAKRSSLTIPDPSVYVESALDMLGVEQSSSGYMIHDLMGQLYKMVPTFIIERNCANIKRKAYKRLKKE